VSSTPTDTSPTTAIIACAALHRELRLVLSQLPGAIKTVLLPSSLHNRPEEIPLAVETAIQQLHLDGIEKIAVAYADCGTGGLLDVVLDRYGVSRLPGAHCYSFFMGEAEFAALAEEELGTFYLTDYLALHFDALVWNGLGLEKHPELRDMYFGNYKRVVWLSQTKDLLTEQKAMDAADKLRLTYDCRHTGLQPFTSELSNLLQ
jgi:Protein of unknown function (DUF1638)